MREASKVQSAFPVRAGEVVDEDMDQHQGRAKGHSPEGGAKIEAMTLFTRKVVARVIPIACEYVAPDQGQQNQDRDFHWRPLGRRRDLLPFFLFDFGELFQD